MSVRALGQDSLVGLDLGHYRIVEKIGAGGMGEVYRARDQHLPRDVAIKVLPPGTIIDESDRKHFHKEALILSQLNHPNVATIHDFDTQQGVDFLVMEYVPGITLSEKVAAGPLPEKEVLHLGEQLAEGLSAAHQHGVVHRDLKPGNLRLAGDGRLKILDFGLATLRRPIADSASTETLGDTQSLAGTLPYMTPEQLLGEEVDARTDIHAAGAVLYAMATGQRPFADVELSQLIGAILHRPPRPATNLNPRLSPELERIIGKCLEKEPENRYQSAKELAIDLRRLQTGVVSAVRLRVTSARWSFARLVGLALGILASVIVLLIVRKPTDPAPSFPVVRAVIKLEPGLWLDGMLREQYLQRPSRTAIVMSKDGRFIVYSAIAENPGLQAKAQLYLRGTDQSEAKPIAGTQGGINPFLSPDDRWVGFWADGKLMKVSVDGGVPVALCNAELSFGASWAVDNSIIFAYLAGSGLFRVSADGGDPESLTTPDKKQEEYSHRLPHCLPDGKGVLFTIMREPFDLQPRTALLDLKTRKWRVLMEDAADARYVPTGHLAFLREGTLMVVPFDLGRHEITGQPVPAIANVMQAINVTSLGSNTAAGQFSLSDSGWLVYVEGGILPDKQNSLVWVDHKGRTEPIASFKAPFFAPRLSPDGQRIAYTTGGTEPGMWVYDLNRGTANRLTGEGKAIFVTWTPDTKRLVFGWLKTGLFNLYWQPADGSSAMERLTTSDYTQYPGSWSPDGAILAFVEGHHSGGDRDILLLDLRSRRITPFLNSSAFEGYPEFSPDGHWMAYVSEESGRLEVYVRPFPGPGGKWLISKEGGQEPLWARDGKQLFYRSTDGGQMWVVDVRSDGGFSAGKTRLLFKAPGLRFGTPIRSWDLSQDGQRFLMVKGAEEKPTPVTEMVLVVNWSEELKRLAPKK